MHANFKYPTPVTSNKTTQTCKVVYTKTQVSIISKTCSISSNSLPNRSQLKLCAEMMLHQISGGWSRLRSTLRSGRTNETKSPLFRMATASTTKRRWVSCPRSSVALMAIQLLSSLPWLIKVLWWSIRGLAWIIAIALRYSRRSFRSNKFTTGSQVQSFTNISRRSSKWQWIPRQSQRVPQLQLANWASCYSKQG